MSQAGNPRPCRELAAVQAERGLPPPSTLSYPTSASHSPLKFSQSVFAVAALGITVAVAIFLLFLLTIHHLVVVVIVVVLLLHLAPASTHALLVLTVLILAILILAILILTVLIFAVLIFGVLIFGVFIFGVLIFGVLPALWLWLEVNDRANVKFALRLVGHPAVGGSPCSWRVAL